MGRDRFSADREIAEEHGAIRTIAKWIELELTRQVESVGGARSDGPLLGPLRSFRDHLARHFRFEEESGVLAAAILARPRAAANLEKWQEQHRRLLLRLNGSIHRLESAPARTELGADFVSELREFFVDLGVHDRFEDELLGASRATEFRDVQRSFEGRSG